MVEAAELFNASAFRRTVAGIAKSLGKPQAAIVPLSGIEQRGRRHRRLGHLLVPVPDHAGLGPAGPPGRARPRPARARGDVHRLERPPHPGRPHRPGNLARLGLLPDRDVPAALGREGRAPPVLPAFAQTQARDPRHQVELGRPDVAERDRAALPAAVDEREVVGDETLAQRRRTRRCRRGRRSRRTGRSAAPAGEGAASAR